MCIHTSPGSDCARNRSRLCRYPLNTDCMRVACLSLLMIIYVCAKKYYHRSYQNGHLPSRFDSSRSLFTPRPLYTATLPTEHSLLRCPNVLHGCWGRSPYDRCARTRVFWRDRGTCARAQQCCVCAWRARCCTVQHTMAWSTSHVMKHIMQCSMLHIAMSPRRPHTMHCTRASTPVILAQGSTCTIFMHESH